MRRSSRESGRHDRRTHNPCDESHWVSCLRENLTISSYGEGLETGRVCRVPRQFLTRQEAFKRLKHRLALEHVTGLSQLAVAQDLAAKIVCDNIHSLLSQAAHGRCPIAQRTPYQSHLRRHGHAARASSAVAWPSHRAGTRQCPWPASAAYLRASPSQNAASTNPTQAPQVHGDENMLTSRSLKLGGLGRLPAFGFFRSGGMRRSPKASFDAGPRRQMCITL